MILVKNVNFSLLVFGQNGLKFARVSWSKDGFFNSGDKTASFRLGGREPVSNDKLTILKKQHHKPTKPWSL